MRASSRIVSDAHIRVILCANNCVNDRQSSCIFNLKYRSSTWAPKYSHKPLTELLSVTCYFATML